MNDMDDDDTHVCLKCRATIIGLDNYVTHRKSGCNTKPAAVIVAHEADDPEKAKEDVDDPDQRADDFFSCLELQSSAKKSPIPAGKTRGKFSVQGEFLMEGASDADVSDSCLMRPSGKNLNLSEKHNMSIVDGIHLGVSVEEDDSNDDYGVEYADLEELDDAHGDYPPRSHTGGKWSRDLINSPPGDWGLIIEDCRGDTPPPHFTGGKWKPSPPVSTSLDVDHTHHQMNPVSRDMHSDDEDDAQGPPPGHTSGKWVPGKRPPMADITQQAGPSSHVWCEACQRRLSSVSMYQRHVRSWRHLRNVAAPGDEEPKPEREKRVVRKPQYYYAADTWVTKASRSKNKAKQRSKSPQSCRWRWKRRESAEEAAGAERCECCDCLVPAGSLGEHLLSVAHYCNMRSEGRWDLLLDNVASVARLAPFQCALCRFYCNTAADFVRHWRSAPHRDVAATVEGGLACSACGFESADAEEMGRHVEGAGHAAAAKGGTDPAVVGRRRVALRCGDCGRAFRYRAQLRRHANRHGHGRPATTAAANRRRPSRETTTAVGVLPRRRIRRDPLRARRCAVCPALLLDLQALRDHMRRHHPDDMFRCSICGKRFALPQEVTNHARRKACTFRTRQDSAEDSEDDDYPSARSRRATKRALDAAPGEQQDGGAEDLQCRHCLFRAKLKSEMLFHETMHEIPVMKSVFVNDKLTVKPMYSCIVCERYIRKSSLRDHIRCHTQEKRHACRRCGQHFTFKATLLAHARKAHGVGRREFRCAECDYRTDLRTSIVRHRLTHAPPPDSLLRCDLCGKTFAHKQYLAQHIKLHGGKHVRCPVEGCYYECRCYSELKVHLQSHSNSRPYSCPECDFRSKTRQQLARHSQKHSNQRPYRCPKCPYTTRWNSDRAKHLRTHTERLTYKCPYCSFACKTMENLRKHVLTTKKHVGRKLYECRFCEAGPDRFATNLVKSFRAHLFAAHRDAFQSQGKAASYIAGVYNGQEDPPHVDNPLPAQPRWRRTRRNVVEKVKEDVVEPPEPAVAKTDEAVDPEELVGAENIIYVDLPGHDGPVTVSVLADCDSGDDGRGSDDEKEAADRSRGIFEVHDPDSKTTVLILDLDHKPDVVGEPRVVLQRPSATPSASTACLGLLRDFCAKGAD